MGVGMLLHEHFLRDFYWKLGREYILKRKFENEKLHGISYDSGVRVAILPYQEI